MDEDPLKLIQLIANISASLAALIAISLHLKALLLNRGKPLKILRAVIYNQPGGKANYYFVIKNKRPYSVQIKKVECYLNDQYVLRKFPDSRPYYFKTFSSLKKLFKYSDILELAPTGEENMFVKQQEPPGEVRKLCFNVWTSYGYFEHVVEDVTVYDSGEVEVTDVSSWETVRTKVEARDKYIIELLKYWWRNKGFW